MAYTLGNKFAKNLCKRIVLLQLIIENVVTCFFGTQCIVLRPLLYRNRRSQRTPGAWASNETGGGIKMARKTQIFRTLNRYRPTMSTAKR